MSPSRFPRPAIGAILVAMVANYGGFLVPKLALISTWPWWRAVTVPRSTSARSLLLLVHVASSDTSSPVLPSGRCRIFGAGLSGFGGSGLAGSSGSSPSRVMPGFCPRASAPASARWGRWFDT